MGNGGDNEADSQLLDDVMHLLIDLRKDARANQDYATADTIRNRLTELGLALLDKKEGTTWERTS
jgi:cysteinyl-tRNA synthetase